MGEAEPHGDTGDWTEMKQSREIEATISRAIFADSKDTALALRSDAVTAIEALEAGRDAAEEKFYKAVENAGPCGACAEVIACGSSMHPHEGCVVAERDYLKSEVNRLQERIGICTVCKKEFEHFCDEPFAQCDCGTWEWAFQDVKTQPLTIQAQYLNAEVESLRKERDSATQESERLRTMVKADAAGVDAYLGVCDQLVAYRNELAAAQQERSEILADAGKWLAKHDAILKEVK